MDKYKEILMRFVFFLIFLLGKSIISLYIKIKTMKFKIYVPSKSIDGIIKNLNNLKSHELRELFNLVEEKIKHNKNNAISILENDVYISTEIRNLFERQKESFLEFKNKNNDFMMDIFVKLLIK